MLPFSMEISGCKKRMKQYFYTFLAFLASWCFLCCPLLCHLSPWLSGGYCGILKSWRQLMNNKMESALSQTVISENALQKRKTDEIPQNWMGEKRHISCQFAEWEGAVNSRSLAGLIVVTCSIAFRITAFTPALLPFRVLESSGTVLALTLQPLQFGFLTLRWRHSPDMCIQTLHTKHGKAKISQQSKPEYHICVEKSPGVLRASNPEVTQAFPASQFLMPALLWLLMPIEQPISHLTSC